MFHGCLRAVLAFFGLVFCVILGISCRFLADGDERASFVVVLAQWTPERRETVLVARRIFQLQSVLPNRRGGSVRLGYLFASVRRHKPLDRICNCFTLLYVRSVERIKGVWRDEKPGTHEDAVLLGKIATRQMSSVQANAVICRSERVC